MKPLYPWVLALALLVVVGYPVARNAAASSLPASESLAPAISTTPVPATSGATPPPRSLFAPAPGSPRRVTGAGVNLALGDINRDGRADVMASGSGRELIVLLGQRDGRLRVASAPIAVPLPPGEQALGDVNSDRIPDLAFVSHDSYAVTLLFGDGAGGFTRAPHSPILMQVSPEPPHTHAIEMRDFNGDGRLDLATINSHANEIAVAFGDGRGVFRRAPGSPYAVGTSGLYPRALGDLNGDRHLDIVATAEGESSRAITLALSDGRGGFRRSSITPRTVRPWQAVIGDVNQDGRPDLVVTHAERNELTVLLGDGRGALAEADGSPFVLGRTGWRPVIADVNRDGKPDVAVAAGDGVCVMLGDGRGGFAPAPGSPFPTGPGPWRTLVGDVNGDGRLDILTSHLEGSMVSVLLGLQAQ